MPTNEAFFQKLMGGLLSAALVGAYSWVWTVQSRIVIVESQMTRLETGYSELSKMPTDIALMKQDIRYMRERFDELTP